jgi:hypothetical protein
VFVDGKHLIDLPSLATKKVRSGHRVLTIVHENSNTRREISLDLPAGEEFTLNEDTK